MSRHKPARLSPLALSAVTAITLLTSSGCPAEVTPEAQQGSATQGAPLTEDDPRVVRDTDDLYPADSVPNPAPAPAPPGSGRPDISNGVCRLYAPKFPDPECCPVETGFDADVVRKLCGHDLYLGESLRHSCGYFFLPKIESGAPPQAIRVSKVRSETASAAAEGHDERLQHRLRDPDFHSTPIPGVEGGMWSQADGIHWAFLPGWPSVRQVSWPDAACSDEAMEKVLLSIFEAKPPPTNAPRPGLVPVARK